MESALHYFSSPWAWAVYFGCAMLIGMSKTGIPNIGTLAIPMFAILFGAKYSTGIVLVLLCFADLIAVIYYRKAFLWQEVQKLLPMALLGLVIGLIVGKYTDDRAFKIIIAACIVLGMIFLLWSQYLLKDKFTKKPWYAPLFGFVMGFSTMMGNAAGPALSIYMLSKKLDKVTFTATAAWFIMILNYTKVPLQALVWDNLSWAGVYLNLLAFPFVLLGGFLGIKILKVIPEALFRKVIIVLVLLSSLVLILV